MEAIFGKMSKNSEHTLFFLFRVIAGVMFSLHGMQKLGWLGTLAKGSPAAFAPAVWGQVWLAYFVALVELIVGIGIALGLFVRLLAVIGGIDMIFALFMAHFPRGWFPLGNYELPMLYLLAFLVFFGYGAGKWALERAFCKKECF